MRLANCGFDDLLLLPKPKALNPKPINHDCHTESRLGRHRSRCSCFCRVCTGHTFGQSCPSLSLSKELGHVRPGARTVRTIATFHLSCANLEPGMGFRALRFQALFYGSEPSFTVPSPCFTVPRASLTVPALPRPPTATLAPTSIVQKPDRKTEEIRRKPQNLEPTCSCHRFAGEMASTAVLRGTRWCSSSASDLSGF